MGMRVERVPVAPEKRCDLRAWDDNDRYLIEVKSFHDDDAIAKIKCDGEVYERSRSSMYCQTAQSKIGDAVQQLRETAGINHQDLCFIALLARSKYGADSARERILGTLYGTRRIVYVGPSGACESRDCLYFSESAFFRHRHDLDGIIFVAPSGIALCLNDHGNNPKRARRSALGRFFLARNALNDLTSLEVEGGFLLADCAIDRRDEATVLQYVAAKYDLKKAFSVEPEEHSALAFVANTRPRTAKGSHPAS